MSNWKKKKYYAPFIAAMKKGKDKYPEMVKLLEEGCEAHYKDGAFRQLHGGCDDDMSCLVASATPFDYMAIDDEDEFYKFASDGDLW